MTKLVLGRVVATPGALNACLKSKTDPALYLARHASGDWGELDEDDRRLNDEALKSGGRLLSVHRLPCGKKIWIITEADRSVTTVLLPEEY